MAPMDVRVAAIVLAAGAGSRFGGGKLLASVDGRPLLQHTLDRLADAGIDDVVVVLGHDAAAIEQAIEWRTERRVVNPEPERGLSSSLAIGRAAVGEGSGAVLIALGDQPTLRADVIRSLVGAPDDPDRPVVVPAYAEDRGRNPVLVRSAGFALLDEASGDRGLGPILAAHPERVQEVAVAGSNPDVDTPADLVGVLEAAWAARVRANREQVDRLREVPDGPDFYAPVSGLFRADPARTDEPALDALLALVRPGETWLDIGAGAGRYALPIAAALATSGGSVVAIDPSSGMLDALREDAAASSISNIRVVEGRWPPPDPTPFAADVALMAHVGYDIEAIGPFLRAAEAVTRRLARRGADGAPAGVGRRRVLAAGPRRVAGRAAGAARVRRAASRDGPRAGGPAPGPRAAAVRDPRPARGVPAPPALGRAREREGPPVPGGARRADRGGRDRRRAGLAAADAHRHRHLEPGRA